MLRNSVTVDYTDAGNTAMPQETASVDVTVDLVASVAWGSAPSNQTVGSGETLSSAYTITLTNTGNGSDTYDLTDNTTESCSPGSLTSESFSLTASVTLGATVTAGTASYDGLADETTIPVSNIVAANFAASDTVVIGGNAYVVVSASSDGDGTTNDTLVVSGDATGDIAGAGVQVGEQITVNYGASGNAGSTSSGTDVCQHDHSLSADGTLALGGVNNPQASDTVSGWSTLISPLQLTVAKYVRNVTDSSKNPGAADITYGSVDYFLSGVTGNPGDTLEYLVVITNGSQADAGNVVFNDTLPNFTTYTTSSLTVDTNGDQSFDQDTVTDETEADGEGGIITQSGQNIDVYPGTGGNEDTNTGGSLTDVNTAPNNKTAIKYSVTID